MTRPPTSLPTSVPTSQPTISSQPTAAGEEDDDGSSCRRRRARRLAAERERRRQRQRQLTSCGDTCYSQSCDYWEENSASLECSSLESVYSCDCSGCECDGNTYESSYYSSGDDGGDDDCTDDENDDDDDDDDDDWWTDDDGTGGSLLNPLGAVSSIWTKPLVFWHPSPSPTPSPRPTILTRTQFIHSLRCAQTRRKICGNW